MAIAETMMTIACGLCRQTASIPATCLRTSEGRAPARLPRNELRQRGAFHRATQRGANAGNSRRTRIELREVEVLQSCTMRLDSTAKRFAVDASLRLRGIKRPNRGVAHDVIEKGSSVDLLEHRTKLARRGIGERDKAQTRRRLVVVQLVGVGAEREERLVSGSVTFAAESPRTGQRAS